MDDKLTPLKQMSELTLHSWSNILQVTSSIYFWDHHIELELELEL